MIFPKMIKHYQGNEEKQTNTQLQMESQIGPHNEIPGVT